LTCTHSSFIYFRIYIFKLQYCDVIHSLHTMTKGKASRSKSLPLIAVFTNSTFVACDGSKFFYFDRIVICLLTHKLRYFYVIFKKICVKYLTQNIQIT